jgi:CubicO group peptidase (beta-lactamase class C family)
MTRLLLCRLAQAGKLGVDMTLAEAFPGVPMQEAYRKATLQDVMRHTAGLPPYTRIGPRITPWIFDLKGSPMEQRSAFAAHVLMEPPAGEVGGRFIYSNAGFSLLGNLMERREGVAWEELMAREVFKPLGLTSAVIGRGAAEAAAPMPVGHAHEGETFRVETDGPPVEGFLAPAGGVVLSIGDFARFAAAQAAAEGGRANDYLGTAVIAKLPGLLPADADKGEGAVFLGGQGTYTAGFAVWPSKQFGIVVATNAGDCDEVCEATVDAIRSVYAPELAAPPKPKPQAPRLGIMIKGQEDGQLIVGQVAPGGLGQKAGLQADDRIVAIDGRPVKELDQDGVLAALRRPGAKLSLLRAGKALELTLPK